MALHKSTQRDFLRSQSVVRKRRKKKMIRLGFRLGLIVTLFVSFGLLSQIDFFSIKKVIISGNQHMSTEELQGIVDTNLAGKLLGMFPKKNVFLYPKQKIINDIQVAYPRIRQVQVYTESFNNLNVRVHERIQSAVWCDVSDCYAVDGTAYIYAPIDAEIITSVDNSIRFEGLEEKIGSQPIGKNMIDENSFKAILSVAHNMANISLPVYRIEFRSKDEVDFWISDSVQAASSTNKVISTIGNEHRRVIFTTRKDYIEAFNNLDAALKSKAFASSTNFEYIDTRFGNKVFYKLMPQQIKTATTSKKK
jgi:cell division septal protein FtsQ